ncbi:hypothetical protein AJ79_02048 [Helicocarpus griseus UAMH5409]|uniref:SET domain-containing protein n=1 Tax=Helicocarpus griseus UAMH5409 TaxID=1447875 RepID=A0A2B7Y5A3_9EURO|nr:hypothetical protein AJ79_02048 [Helicocarpus griseus UAMH5409]
MSAQLKCDSTNTTINVMGNKESPGLALLMQREDATALLYADPHNPLRHLQRGVIHFELGYPDLAAADAYRALTLFEAVADPDSSEYRARKRVGLESVEAVGGLGVGDEAGVEEGVSGMSVQDGDDGSGDEGSDYGDLDDDGESEEDDEDGFEPISQDEYAGNIPQVYVLLVKSLVRCGCMRDAYDFCMQALNLPDVDLKSTSNVLQEQLAIIKRSFVEVRRSRQRRIKEQAAETEDELLAKFNPADLVGQGCARRVLYPWNTHEPDRGAPETLQLLNERLKKVAPKCEVRPIALPALYESNNKERDEETSLQLGLVALDDLAPGETILHESSLLTATNRLHDDICDACNGPLPDLSATNNPSIACENCEDTIFCSQACHDLAQDIYHAAVCGQEGLESIGKDIQDPKDKADYLYLLLLGRALAMAATQHMHPLDLPEVKYIWGDFYPLDDGMLPPSPTPPLDSSSSTVIPQQAPSATLPFSFHLTILQPMRLLEEMGLDPFTTLPRYDTWVLNTLYAKFRGTASGRLSTWDGGPEVCAVHPLWCLANHSCDPNVRWEWGGEITFTVRGQEERVEWGGKKTGEGGGGIGIRKEEEILNHYCDVKLGVKERREWAMGALGGLCRCERCLWEQRRGESSN